MDRDRSREGLSLLLTSLLHNYELSWQVLGHFKHYSLIYGRIMDDFHKNMHFLGKITKICVLALMF